MQHISWQLFTRKRDTRGGLSTKRDLAQVRIMGKKERADAVVKFTGKNTMGVAIFRSLGKTIISLQTRTLVLDAL